MRPNKQHRDCSITSAILGLFVGINAGQSRYEVAGPKSRSAMFCASTAAAFGTLLGEHFTRYRCCEPN